MKAPIIWAIDDGYGDNKMTPDGGVTELIMPSFATTWRPKKKAELHEGETLDPLSYIAIEFDGQKVIVGQGAVEQDTGAYATLGSNKHLNKNFPAILKTCFGLMAKKEREIVDLLVMGLPVEADEEPDRHELLRKLVVGWHEFTMELADGSILRREINIKDILIKKQPFASLCDLMLDKQGEFERLDIAKGFNVVADVGARTFNVYALKDLRPISDLSFNTYDGMFVAYYDVDTTIRPITGIATPDAKLPHLINVDGEINGVSLEPYKIEAYDTLANKLVNILEGKLVNSWGLVTRVIWTGGGSELIADNIRKYMPRNNLSFLTRFSTARGLWKIGKRHMMKKIKAAAPEIAATQEPTV
jgi:plasmid segregation protein ParM